VEAVPDLENYLRTAPIAHTAELRRGGGGHQHKQLMVLDGGLGVVAKLAEPAGDDLPQRMVRAEVAGWLLAVELGWSQLVPTTVLRTVPSIFTGSVAEASVQVVWPLFDTALERTATVADCPEDSSWQIALFDALAANSDRNESNWGFIRELSEPKLIDHGHAFEAHVGGPSPFVERWRNQEIPAEHLENVERFLAGSADSRLREFLDHDVVDRIGDRARQLVENERLTL
jgi:hypothetical protein